MRGKMGVTWWMKIEGEYTRERKGVEEHKKRDRGGGGAQERDRGGEGGGEGNKA